MFLIICFLLILAGSIAWSIITNIRYKKTEYFKQTGKSLFALRADSGCWGEYQVYLTLKHLESIGVRFLFNCYLPAQDGKTSEVDVIMIHTSGIFVIESKNYSGWIFGSEDRQQWTQTLPSGRMAHKEHFYNPVMQNRTHIKWLRKQIEEHIPIHSIIVFSDDCELKDITIHSSNIKVINRYKLLSTIIDLSAKTEDKLTPEKIEDIYFVLLKFVNVSDDIKTQHIKDIQQAEYNSIVSPFSKEGVCPKCGGKLVPRTAKKGVYAGSTFLGCSNYPRCKYIRSDQ
ncbi:MAG: NERD domain-containing protein [Lachnospiraceae bacterium]|nr:NERD domain-containing protein [Lachnospiraceae bacterium]